MEELLKALEGITYRTSKFPREEFQTIKAHQEEAVPYLREAIQKALDERDALDEEYQLHFYALFLLGEFQDREFFPKIIEMISLPEEELDYLIGDAVTSGLPDVLYNTFNGDLDLLKRAIMDVKINEFARAGMLRVMGQLYLDGTLKAEEWKDFIKQNVHSGTQYDYIYNEMASAICTCHFVDMLPEIRFMLDNELMDTMCMGEYDSCVDQMFRYDECEQKFCKSPISAQCMLQTWAMFEDEKGSEVLQKDYEKLLRAAEREYNKPISKKKIGRNAPCPCGSGKKYKYCCMNNPGNANDAIESEQEQERWLKEYPKTGNKRQKGRIYLEEYFDAESIRIDKILYLGLMQRPGLIWLKNEENEKNRTRAYLQLAFSEFMKRVEREQIKTFAEYDKKYSIHYLCEEWMSRLLDLLEDSGDESVYAEVMKCCRRMG